MTLDARARNTASKMLTKFGKRITLSRITEGVYNPATGDVGNPILSTLIVYALIKDYKGIDLVSGVIQQGDRKVTIPALGVAEPQPLDKVTIDSLVYSVISVRSVWSGEQAAMFEMQVRK